jgi:hypothetical protein
LPISSESSTFAADFEKAKEKEAKRKLKMPCHALPII